MRTSCTLPVSAPEKTTVTEQTTLGFRHDLDNLSPNDRARVLETLRHGYRLLQDSPRNFFAKTQRPLPIHLKGGLTSSLYSLRVGRDLQIIMTVDDDPIFGQFVVTLFRVVSREELERSYRSIARLLYRNQIERNGSAT